MQTLADGGAGDASLLSGLPPHLTLAEFNTDRLDDVAQSLSVLARTVLQPIPIRLASAGFFPGDPLVLYLAPIVDERLLELHRQVNGALEPHCAVFSPLYREENWVPHCTLALELDQTAFAAAVQALVACFSPLESTATQLSIIACCPFCEQAVFALAGPQVT
jgi:2'-5' RNA ligase